MQLEGAFANFARMDNQCSVRCCTCSLVMFVVGGVIVVVLAVRCVACWCGVVCVLCACGLVGAVGLCCCCSDV